MRFSWWIVAVVVLGCESQPAAGASCTRAFDCTAPLVCAVGHCRPACAESRDCAAGSHCLIDPTTHVGACSLDMDACRDHACPIGFVCRDGQCLNACGLVVACPDRLCQEGACVPQRDPPDASGPDGGGGCHGPGCDPVVQIESTSVDGYDLGHVCARTASGAVWCWGLCSSGECGDAITAHGACGCSGAPIRVLDETGMPLVGALDVAAAEGVTCVLRPPNGEVWCWGSGTSLVIQSFTPLVPDPIRMDDGSLLSGVTDIEAGQGHACALRGPGTQPLCWGNGANYRLGNGVLADSSTPVAATELAPTSLMRIDARHTIVLDAGGALVGVGANDTLELGVVTPMVDAMTGARPSLPAIRTFDTHTEWTGAVFTDGRVATWGTLDDTLGAAPPSPIVCPNVSVGMCSVGPAWIDLPAGFVPAGIAMGQSAALVWGQDGSLWGWANALSPSAPTPVRIDVPGHVIAATMFAAGGCVLTMEGDVSCFGPNAVGLLGRGMPGTFDMALAPVAWP